MCRELLQLVWRVVLDGFAPYGASLCAPYAPARQDQEDLGEPAPPILVRLAIASKRKPTMEQ